MTSAVLDANVLASGFVRSNSSAAPVQLLDAYRARRYLLIVSKHILSELVHTLEDPYIQRRLTPEQIALDLALLRAQALVTMKTPAPSRFSEAQWQQFEAARRHIARAFRPWIEDYRALQRRLRAEGFRVRWTCMLAPVQLEGNLPSGERFLFHCRHSTCRLSIAPKGGDPILAPTWEASVSRWERHAAGCLEAVEAETVLRELLAAYQQSEQQLSAHKEG